MIVSQTDINTFRMFSSFISKVTALAESHYELQEDLRRAQCDLHNLHWSKQKKARKSRK